MAGGSSTGVTTNHVGVPVVNNLISGSAIGATTAAGVIKMTKAGTGTRSGSSTVKSISANNSVERIGTNSNRAPPMKSQTGTERSEYANRVSADKRAHRLQK